MHQSTTAQKHTALHCTALADSPLIITEDKMWEI